jgi:hypothetical protein
MSEYKDYQLGSEGVSERAKAAVKIANGSSDGIVAKSVGGDTAMTEKAPKAGRIKAVGSAEGISKNSTYTEPK